MARTASTKVSTCRGIMKTLRADSYIEHPTTIIRLSGVTKSVVSRGDEQSEHYDASIGMFSDADPAVTVAKVTEALSKHVSDLKEPKGFQIEVFKLQPNPTEISKEQLLGKPAVVNAANLDINALLQDAELKQKLLVALLGGK